MRHMTARVNWIKLAGYRTGAEGTEDNVAADDKKAGRRVAAAKAVGDLS